MCPICGTAHKQLKKNKKNSLKTQLLYYYIIVAKYVLIVHTLL